MRTHLQKGIGLAFAAAAMLGAAPTMATGSGGPDYFPNVRLTTQDGKVVRFYDDLLKNRSVVVNLIYTRCTASCPLETAKLSQVQKILGDRVGKDIFFYSISIDPEHDTPEALKAYAAKFHVQPGWLFLTGKEEDIKLISKKLGLASLTDAASRDGHQPSLMIGRDATGQWMRNSAVDNPRFLATTILHFLDGYNGAVPARNYAAMGPLHDIGKGEYLFKSRCAACHTVGRGDAVGPDLEAVTTKRDRTWLSRYIARPDQVLAEGDPIAKALFAKYKSVRMPNLSMSSEETEAVLSYIERRSKIAASTAALQSPPAQ
jgi:protein SCO1/2